MSTIINLTPNLHEKMKLAIIHYIRTIKETENEPNNILNIYKNATHRNGDIINVLFPASACKTRKLFHKIARDYFVKKDYNELAQYNHAYFMNRDDKPDWYFDENIYWRTSKYLVLIDPAYVFARLHSKFIIEELKMEDNCSILK